MHHMHDHTSIYHHHEPQSARSDSIMEPINQNRTAPNSCMPRTNETTSSRTATMVMSLLALYQPLLLLALLLPLFLLLQFLTKKPLAHNKTLLPSPRGFPLLGHLPLLGALPHRTLRELAAVHGPVMLLRLGCVPTVIVSSAAAAQEAMKTRDLAFASRPRMRMAELLLYGRDVAFSPYGEYWRQARRICVLHLLSLRRIQSFRPVREQQVGVLIGKIHDSCKAGGGACSVNVSKLLISLTNSVVSHVAFGPRYGAMEGDGFGSRVDKALAELMVLLGTMPVGELVPWLGWVDWVTGLERRANHTFRVLDELLEMVIDDHRRQTREQCDENDGSDFVDVLLEVSAKDKEIGVSIGKDGMKAIILDMFSAGTDTAYTIMEWVIAELIKHPEEMNKSQEEVRTTVGRNKNVTEEHLERLGYLKAVIKEAFRLHPPAPLLVPRETLEDTELLGHHIPARTRVMINAWAIGRDPRSWARAEEFRPERFVGSPVDYMGLDFQLIPFGAGRRGCPGVGFAIPTIELALASLLYHFDWALPNGQKSESPDMTEANGITVHLKHNLVLVARPWFD